MAYIKDSAIACLEKMFCELIANSDKISKIKAMFLKNYVIPTLEASKTADGMEVVRCKDCKHFAYGVCTNDFALNLSRADDFCSYGERIDT